MLRVTVDLIPFGDESKKQKLAEMVVINDASRHDGYGNYKIVIKDTDLEKTKKYKIIDHLRSDGFWPLLIQAISKHVKTTNQSK